MNTLQLDGWQLDYFTGLALGHEMLISNDGTGPAYIGSRTDTPFEPSCRAMDMHHVLLRMASVLRGADGNKDWMARAAGCSTFARGPDPAVAVCRALVLHVFGLRVELPSGQTGTDSVSYKNDSVSDACDDLFA